MAKNTRIFSDLDFSFTPHPVSGDVTRKFDEDAVKQSIKNLILTRNYERPFHSDIGSQIKALLFEPLTPVTASILRRTIENTISSYEPRANVLDIQVLISPDNNSLYVTVVFAIVNTNKPITVDLFLERTR